jgi:ABC-type glycerol-3-phosphate transport system permease component
VSVYQIDKSLLLEHPKSKQFLAKFGLYFALGIFALIILIPFYWLFISALTPSNELFRIPPNYFPHLTWINFKTLVTQIPFLDYLSNSIIFSVGTSILSIAISFLAAYGFARIQVPGSNILLLGLVLSSALPEIATVVPLFETLRNFGMINTLQGLIVVMSSVLVPFTVWTLVSFIKQVPVELEEAAKVDGITNIPFMLWKIVIPIVKPALSTMLVINFVNSWNNLIYPLVFTSTVKAKTLSVSITEVFQARSPYGRPWELISSLAIAMVVPVILLVFVSQKSIVSGLAKGSIK